MFEAGDDVRPCLDEAIRNWYGSASKVCPLNQSCEVGKASDSHELGGVQAGAKRLPPHGRQSFFVCKKRLRRAVKPRKAGGEVTAQTQILDATAMQRSITRMAHEILERNKGLNGVILIGIKTRGAVLADRLAAKLAQIEGAAPPVWHLDVRPYRDDVSGMETTRLPVEGLGVKRRTVVLVDDVLYTGRTVRAALDAVMASGRPSLVQLTALIDRGHRELPIRPDVIGKNVPTSREESVSVRFTEVDGEDGVWIVKSN